MSHATAQDHTPDYYVPHGTYWPILGSFALFFLLGGAAILLNGGEIGRYLMGIGAILLLWMLFGWFGTVIRESETGMYSSQVDVSFRWGMGWFIISEVFFFSAFFGALYYARSFVVPWLGGEGAGGIATHEFLWPSFEAVWPSNGPEAIGGVFKTMGAFGIPALNTIILLTSGVTVTFAHWAIIRADRTKFVLWLLATVLLGFIFAGFQAYEYIHAYSDLNLKLSTGIYGSTFFMLTGFHGLHVIIGAIILTVVMLRAIRGHFTAKNHFAFEAAAWYWHFVDVVWLGLFIFVYWL